MQIVGDADIGTYRAGILWVMSFYATNCHMQVTHKPLMWNT